MYNLYLRLEELSEFEDWIESELEKYTLADYYLLPEDIQEEVEDLYIGGDFYAALELLNTELGKSIQIQKPNNSENDE